MNTTTETESREKPAEEIFSQEEITEKSADGQEAILHTDPVKAKMLNALIKSLGIVAYAAQQAGIGRRTHYLWMKTDEEYKAVVESISEVSLDYAEARLFKHLQQNDLKAITFTLRTRGRARGYSMYKEREAERHAAIFNLVVKDKETAEMIMQTKEKQ